MTTATPQVADTIVNHLAGSDPALIDEINVGLDRLSKMSHDDLRAFIARRVDLLQNTLTERESRRQAIGTAKLASRLLEMRRDRAIRIKRRVDGLSMMTAACGTIVLFAVML